MAQVTLGKFFMVPKFDGEGANTLRMNLNFRNVV